VSAVETSPLTLAHPSGLASALTTRWGRLLIPSLSDFFFIALTLWLFATGPGWNGLLLDGDTGWHIRTGEYIAANHSVPTVDLFSYSKPGEPWYAWEWLCDVLYAGLHGAFGLKGIVLFSGLVIVAAATLLMRHMLWRGATALAALAVTMLVVGASSVHFHARPHLITLLFLVISMWLIDRDRRAPDRLIWILVPLTALWTNLHGGFLALIACLGLLILGSLLEGIIAGRVIAGRIQGAGRFSETIRYTKLLALCGLATLINPYGYKLHMHTAEYLRSDWIRQVVQEFQSPSFQTETMLQFELLLFLGLITAGALLRRGKIVEPLWILYWGHAALSSTRHVPLYAIVSAPFLACELTRWWSSLCTGRPRQSVLTILSDVSRDFGVGFRRTTVWLGIFVIAITLLGPSMRWPTDFPAERFPAKFLTDYREEILHGRVLTTDQWGDYLIYHLYPKVKVFVDGRSDFYGPEVGKQYLTLLEGGYGWDAQMRKWNFDVVLIPVTWPLGSLLKQRQDWQVVADDGKTLLFRRTTAIQAD
jgi:hypothetical protein